MKSRNILSGEQLARGYRSESRSKSRSRDNKRQNNTKPIQIYYALMVREQYHYNVWDVIVMMSRRNTKTVVICSSRQIANRLIQNYKLNRKLAGVDSLRSNEKLLREFNEGKIQILILQNQVYSILVAKDQLTRDVQLLVKFETPRAKQLSIYTPILGSNGKFVIIDEKFSSLENLQLKSKISIIPISFQNNNHIIKEIIQDIKYEQTKNENLVQSIDSEVNLTKDQIIERLMSLLIKSKIAHTSVYLKYQGYNSYLIHTNVQFHSLNYIWNIFKEQFSSEAVRSILGLTKFKNNKGAVFEFALAYSTQIQRLMDKLNNIKTRRYFIELANQIPDLQDVNSQQYKRKMAKAQYAHQHRKDLEVQLDGLDLEVNETQIKRIFQIHGIYIIEVKILKVHQAKSRAALVLCSDYQNKQKLLRLEEIKIKGRILKIQV